MKIKYGLWIYSIISIASLILSGCGEEYKSTTKINSDGSCERIIIVKADSSYIQSSTFHIPTDKSWDPQFKLLEKDTQKVFVIHKMFNDVNKINDEYKNKNNVGVEIKFDKKFRWFFTYFDYKETYKAYNPFNIIPLSSYLTKEEFAQYEKGDTSKTLKQRLDKYFEKNVFEYFFNQLIEAVQKLNDSSLPVNLFTSNKQAIYDKLFMEKEANTPKEITQRISSIIKSKSVSKLEPEIEKIMNEIMEKLQASDVKYAFTNEIIMPGIILNTNSATVEGNKVSWKFGADRFHYTDYSMNVESRISNVWTILVTCGVVVVIIALLLLPRIRKNKIS